MAAPEPLRVLSFGAGAIGTYVGGSLALHGHQVVFLERPAVVEQLCQRGLRLNLHGQEAHIPDPVLAASPQEALRQGPYHFAIFALKSFDTKPALESLLSAAGHPAGQIPPILCLQNGVENEAMLAKALGPEKVIAGTVTSAIGRRAAGDILLERLRGIGVAAGNPLSTSIVSYLQTAGLNARLYPSAGDMKWSKLLANLLANASSAILDMTPAEIFAHPGLYRLEIAQLREALAVMAAQDLHPVDLPGTPVRLLAFGARYLPLAISRPLMKRAVGGGRGGKMPSFHIDLHGGRGLTEVDYLNGAVVRYGERYGIPTPANRLLNQTLTALAEGKLPMEKYRGRPEALLKGIRDKG